MTRCKCGAIALYENFYSLECPTYGCTNGPKRSPVQTILANLRGKLALLLGAEMEPGFDVVVMNMQVEFTGQLPDSYFESAVMRLACHEMMADAATQIRDMAEAACMY